MSLKSPRNGWGAVLGPPLSRSASSSIVCLLRKSTLYVSSWSGTSPRTACNTAIRLVATRFQHSAASNWLGCQEVWQGPLGDSEETREKATVQRQEDEQKQRTGGEGRQEEMQHMDLGLRPHPTARTIWPFAPGQHSTHPRGPLHAVMSSFEVFTRAKGKRQAGNKVSKQATAVGE